MPGSYAQTTTTNVTVKTSTGTMGEYLADANGMSLYMFDLDNPGKSNCLGQCAKVWPPLTVSGSQSTFTAGGTANSSMLSPITRDDGILQLTYNKLPLYTYAGDKAAGDTNGQGIKESGGMWYLVKPDGTKLMPTGSTAQ
ncbi:MAG: hypothetical protein HY074_14480 [Deltaproteobacteria bacterium]|nr:hypothetical protein [Deltaproteobacteria bacterium]